MTSGFAERSGAKSEIEIEEEEEEEDDDEEDDDDDDGLKREERDLEMSPRPSWR